MKKINQKNTAKWHLIITVIVAALMLTAAVIEWPRLKPSLELLEKISLSDISLLVGLFIVVQLFACLSYASLSLKPLAFLRLFLIELASAGINRLVPAGIGSMGVHGKFLLKNRHTVPQTAAVISTNNFVSIIVHLLLLGICLVFTSQELSMPLTKIAVVFVPIIFIALLIILVLSRVRSAWDRLQAFIKNFRRSLNTYLKNPNKIVHAAFTACGATLTMTTILYFSAQFIGSDLSFLQAFIVYSGGSLLSSFMPTPGGLGGVDAALLAGLLIAGMNPVEGMSATMLFRLVTHWLPIIIGLPVFGIVRTKKYI